MQNENGKRGISVFIVGIESYHVSLSLPVVCTIARINKKTENLPVQLSEAVQGGKSLKVTAKKWKIREIWRKKVWRDFTKKPSEEKLEVSLREKVLEFFQMLT